MAVLFEVVVCRALLGLQACSIIKKIFCINTWCWCIICWDNGGYVSVFVEFSDCREIDIVICCVILRVLWSGIRVRSSAEAISITVEGAFFVFDCELKTLKEQTPAQEASVGGLDFSEEGQGQ